MMLDWHEWPMFKPSRRPQARTLGCCGTCDHTHLVWSVGDSYLISYLPSYLKYSFSRNGTMVRISPRIPLELLQVVFSSCMLLLRTIGSAARGQPPFRASIVRRTFVTGTMRFRHVTWVVIAILSIVVGGASRSSTAAAASVSHSSCTRGSAASKRRHVPRAQKGIRRRYPDTREPKSALPNCKEPLRRVVSCRGGACAGRRVPLVEPGTTAYGSRQTIKVGSTNDVLRE